MRRSASSSFFTETNILWLFALALFLLHMVTNHQYGFHQDELAVLDNANNLDWGFVEYPPLTPFLARIELAFFGLSPVSARTFAALAHSVVLVLTGLMARELGGRRLTQILAALAAAIAPIALIQGSLIQYVTFDFLWSVLIFLPNLIWQIRHNFISLEFLSSIHERDVQIGRAEGYLIEQFLFCSNPFAIPFWIAGLIFYFKGEAGKRYRMIGWMYVIPFLIYLITQGRSYYLAPAYPMLIAAGAVAWQGWIDRLSVQQARLAQGVMWAEMVIGAIVSGALALPIAPINSPLWDITSEVHDTFTEQIGWPEMIETVAGIYAGLPEEEKPRAGILTGENDEAAALNLYGPDHGLPKAISGSDTFWLRGYGDPPPETVIVVGYSREIYAAFEQCKQAGIITNPYGIENDLRDPPIIFVCRGPRLPWPQLWKRLQRYS